MQRQMVMDDFGRVSRSSFQKIAERQKTLPVDGEMSTFLFDLLLPGYRMESMGCGW